MSSPNGISLRVMSLSAAPYILLRNTVFLTDLPVSVEEIEKITYYCYYVNLLGLRRLVAGVLCQKPGFECGPGRLGFEKDIVVLRQVFLPVLQFSPVSIIPPLLHTHSSIYHPRCIMFFSRYSVFPCQCHSIIAPYSFIHLPLTLYNVFLPVLQFFPVSIIPPLLHTHSTIYHPHCIMFFSQYFSFPLSVSFHHRSILIHSSTNHAV